MFLTIDWDVGHNYCGLGPGIVHIFILAGFGRNIIIQDKAAAISQEMCLCLMCKFSERTTLGTISPHFLCYFNANTL